jgi:hypothetical protein
MYLLRQLLSKKKGPTAPEIKSLSRKIVASKPFPKAKEEMAITFIGIANSVELF